MNIVESGHVYDLTWLDGKPKTFVFEASSGGETLRGNRLTFVNREDSPHPGTQSQEVLRALIDRTMHCDNCLPWDGNPLIIKHLRMALALHEARALERKTEKELMLPETIATDLDGHFMLDDTESVVSDDHQMYRARRGGDA